MHWRGWHTMMAIMNDFLFSFMRRTLCNNYLSLRTRFFLSYSAFTSVTVASEVPIIYPSSFIYSWDVNTNIIFFHMKSILKLSVLSSRIIRVMNSIFFVCFGADKYCEKFFFFLSLVN